ncbi:MAG: class I SAM-dependent methyltransferase [Gammaproteobacteria bacterium]
MNAQLQPLDFSAIKTRQQAAWAAGDYAVVGTTLQIVGETLCEAVDVNAGEAVLDVAAGNGNAALAAARRGADVIATDYVYTLLERARARAAADGLTLKFQEADAEALPFGDDRFDVVLSTFGVMFTPDQPGAARELLRVCRRGGRIGLANWTPESLIGQLFRTLGGHVPPPPGLQSPALWGTEARLRELFGPQAADIQCQRRHFTFRYRSAAQWLDVFRHYYGPLNKAFATLPPERQVELADDLVALVERFNRGREALAAPSEYLEVVVTKRA